MFFCENESEKMEGGNMLSVGTATPASGIKLGQASYILLIWTAEQRETHTNPNKSKE